MTGHNLSLPLLLSVSEVTRLIRESLEDQFREVWVEGENGFQLFASGLHEILGLAFHEGALYATQRAEVTKIRDTDGDGIMDFDDPDDDNDGIPDFVDLDVEGDFDIDGVKLYPGSKVGSVDVNAGETGGKDKARVEMGFTSPAAPAKAVIPVHLRARELFRRPRTAD